MLQGIVKKIADNKNNQSLSHQYRSRRFDLFKSLLKELPRPLRILDIGGTVEFWQAMNFQEPEVSITLLNLEDPQPLEAPYTAIKGDATDLSGMANGEYDIVFSNSVIEHLYTWQNQQQMAAEVLRVGQHHFIQTPNYWFPIEPHWVFPFFQYFPKAVRRLLTQYCSLGHIGRIKDAASARNQVNEIRLLSKKEMQQLFPQSEIYAEKFLGFNKSYTAYSFTNQAHRSR